MYEPDPEKQDTIEIDPIEVALSYLEREAQLLRHYTNELIRREIFIKCDWILDGLIDLNYV